MIGPHVHMGPIKNILSLLSRRGVCSCPHQIHQNSLKSGRIWGEANKFGDGALDLPPINNFITV